MRMRYGTIFDSPEEMVTVVNKVKKESGVRCIDAEQQDIVETATGNVVAKLITCMFEGNIFKLYKAKKIFSSWAASKGYVDATETIKSL